MVVIMVISSPFLLWKVYLDKLGKIISNQCDKFLLPALFANICENECRGSTVSTLSNFLCLKRLRLKKKCF